jgi:hypothetical protein
VTFTKEPPKDSVSILTTLWLRCGLSFHVIIFGREWRLKECGEGPGMMEHTSNPSYSRGRDQEDHSFKSVWAKKKKRK